MMSGAMAPAEGVELAFHPLEALPPGARIFYDLMPRLRVYGDVGLGATLYNFSVRVSGASGSGGATFEGRTAGFAFRVGLGAEYALLDKLSLNIEPMNLLFGFNDSVVYEVSGNTIRGQDPMPFHWGILLGVTYRP